MTRPATKQLPYLLGISGPAQKIRTAIDVVTRLGRDAVNTVSLDDETVSRLHAELYTREGRVFARDLGSTNGTYINGARLSKGGERELKHRDVLKIGNSRFLFLEREEQAGKTPVTKRDANRERKTTTIRVGPIDELIARSDKSFGDAFIAFGNAMIRIGTTQDMLARSLEAVFDTMPAERAAIVLLGGSEIYRELQSDSSSPFEIDSFMRQQAVRDGVPVQSNDEDAVLCVPIATPTATLGFIYVQNPDSAALDGRHLERLCAIAGFVAPALENLLEKDWLRAQVRLHDDLHLHHSELVGNSVPMKEVYRTIQKVAATNATVLILGENGSGKELAAAAIHRNSARAGKPFVIVNCGAIAEELKQSELFGHEKGSFTGATAQRKGKLEIADGGTVFLDEIGELSLNIQVTLLRFLQEKEIQRVGGNIVIHSDVRVIAATNRNLEQMVRQGTFREDLYYRLRVVPLVMPSLADRAEDIPLLAAHFIKILAPEAGKSVVGLSRDAHELLMSHDWKGNVREMKNAILGSLVFAEGDYIRAEDLRRVLDQPLPIKRKADDSLESFVERAERWLIESVLAEVAGNQTAAAQRLNVHPVTLYRRMEKLKIRHDPE